MKTKNSTSKSIKKTTKHSPAKLAQDVKEKAFALGAHLVGIAPISRMRHAPPDLHPKRLLPETKSLISMAYRLNRGVQQVHLRGISPMSFSRFAGLEPKFRLDDMALDLANFLEDLDYKLEQRSATGCQAGTSRPSFEACSAWGCSSFSLPL